MFQNVYGNFNTVPFWDSAEKQGKPGEPHKTWTFCFFGEGGGPCYTVPFWDTYIYMPSQAAKKGAGGTTTPTRATTLIRGTRGHHPHPPKRQTRREGGGLLSLEERNEEMTETRIELTDNQRAKLCKMLHSMLLCGICEALLDRATDKKTAKALDDLEREEIETVARLSRELFGGPIL